MAVNPHDAGAIFALTGLVMGSFSAFSPSIGEVRDAPGRMSEVGTRLRGGQITAVGFVLSIAGMACYLTKDWLYMFLAVVIIVMYVFVQENALRSTPGVEVEA